MAVTTWATAKSAAVLILREGAAVSVASVASGNTTNLKWKRENPDGTWPSDAAAVQVLTLTKAEPFALLQLPDGSVLISNGIDKFRKTKTNDPKATGDFLTVTIL